MEFGIGNERQADKTFKKIELVMAKNTRAVRQMMFSLMEDLHRSANHEILSGIKSGRIYIRRAGYKRNKKGQFKKGSRKKRRHQASAPGETHANLTGKLRRSLSWKVYGSDSSEFGYGVSTTGKNEAPEYSDFVEFGTDKMEPRPTLQNELVQVDTKAQLYFDDALKEEGFDGS